MSPRVDDRDLDRCLPRENPPLNAVGARARVRRLRMLELRIIPSVHPRAPLRLPFLQDPACPVLLNDDDDRSCCLLFRKRDMDHRCVLSEFRRSNALPMPPRVVLPPEAGRDRGASADIALLSPVRESALNCCAKFSPNERGRPLDSFALRPPLPLLLPPIAIAFRHDIRLPDFKDSDASGGKHVLPLPWGWLDALGGMVWRFQDVRKAGASGKEGVSDAAEFAGAAVE